MRAPRLAIVGGGPAGLVAAEVARAAGCEVDLYERMGSVGRKFLIAGKGGLNLTHGEPFDAFVARYRERNAEVERWLRTFDADALRAWAHGLGVDTVVGSSGRVFPRDLKAAPLLRGWVRRLRAQGVRFHVQHRLMGVEPCEGGGFALRFQTHTVVPAQAGIQFSSQHEAQLESAGLERLAWSETDIESVCDRPNALHGNDETDIQADAVILALGGGSWPQLGSDGSWTDLLHALGADLRPLVPANGGFECAWSAHFRQRFVGQPVKPVRMRWLDVQGRAQERQGEFIVTAHGVEGSLIYAASADLRERITREGHADLTLDLAPERDLAALSRALAQPRVKRSIGDHLRRSAQIDGVRAGLLFEFATPAQRGDANALAALIKQLPLRLMRTRPLAEAISSAGGVRLETLDQHLMLRTQPGLFCAGEMLDWEAPTGGYLLTASFASGVVAARAALRWLAAQDGYAAPDRIGN